MIIFCVTWTFIRKFIHVADEADAKYPAQAQHTWLTMKNNIKGSDIYMKETPPNSAFSFPPSAQALSPPPPTSAPPHPPFSQAHTQAKTLRSAGLFSHQGDYPAHNSLRAFICTIIHTSPNDGSFILHTNAHTFSHSHTHTLTHAPWLSLLQLTTLQSNKPEPQVGRRCSSECY